MGDLLLVTGDASSDKYAAQLVSYLTEQEFPGTIYAAAGHRTEDAGAELIRNVVDHGVVGITEAAGSIFYFVSLLRDLDDLLMERPVRGVVMMDFPGFNLQMLARWIRFRGFDIPLYYYIPPQVWAWRQGRVKKLRDWFRRLFVIFPFEEEFYAQHGVEAEFVGHPMLESRSDSPPFNLRERLEIDPDQRIVSFFPGSRNHEIKRHLPIMGDVAMDLLETYDDVVPIMSAASTVNLDSYRSAMSQEMQQELPVWSGDSRSLLEASTFCVLTSGTVTMEATFAGTPMVVGYRTSMLTYWIGRMLIHSESIAMPNLIRPETAVPEYIQSEFTRESIGDNVERYLEHPEELVKQRRHLETITRMFEKQSPSREVGDVLLKELAPAEPSRSTCSSQTNA